MSADLLRRAAAKIRKTAENAGHPWEWYTAEDLAGHNGWSSDGIPGAMYQPFPHMALWSPGVALCVADLLDSRAQAIERDGFRALSLVPDDDDITTDYLARMILKED